MQALVEMFETYKCQCLNHLDIRSYVLTQPQSFSTKRSSYFLYFLYYQLWPYYDLLARASSDILLFLCQIGILSSIGIPILRKELSGLLGQRSLDLFANPSVRKSMSEAGSHVSRMEYHPSVAGPNESSANRGSDDNCTRLR